MTPKKLKTLLKKKGVTQADLAREADISQVMIYHVVHGRSRSRRIENIIAARVQRQVDDIFPITPAPILGREK